MTRAQICDWEQENRMQTHPIFEIEGKSPYRLCLAQDGEFQKTSAKRQEAFEHNWRVASAFAAGVALLPILLLALLRSRTHRRSR